MDDPIDHSDQIAALRISIDFLNEWEPNGPWQNFPLLKKWQRSHYSLSVEDMNTLTGEMLFRAESAKKKMFVKNNVQQSLFD